MGGGLEPIAALQKFTPMGMMLLKWEGFGTKNLFSTANL